MQHQRNRTSHNTQRNQNAEKGSQYSQTQANFQKNTITIPHSEIVRMKQNCQSQDPDQYDKENKQREKQELYEKSKQRVKNWPNTIHAFRKKKDEWRFEKFQKEEEERRKIDKEEAIYQAEVRKDILLKANKQIYDRNDKVKTFTSKLLLVDALQEREAQIEIKKQVKEIEQMKEEMYYQQQLDMQKQFDEQERRKEEILKEKKALTQRILKEQHDEMKAKFIKKLQDEKIEGEIIKQKAQEALAKEKQEEQARKERIIQNQLETKKGNEQLQVIREKLKEKEKEEEEKIKKYADKKEKIMEMRKRRAEVKQKEKQDERQRLIDAQIQRLQKIKDQENSRINKQLKEAEIKADLAEQKKREAIKEQKRRFDDSIKLTLLRKQQQAEEQKQEDVAYQKFWEHKNIEIQQKERQEKQEAFQRAKDLSNFHLAQQQQKQKIREEDFIQQMNEAQKIQQIIENEDKEFEQWALRQISTWQKEGKNIRPLLVELEGYKKRIR